MRANAVEILDITGRSRRAIVSRHAQITTEKFAAVPLCSAKWAASWDVR